MKRLTNTDFKEILKQIKKGIPVVITDAIIENCNLSNKSLKDITFINCLLRNTNFSNSKLTLISFKTCKIYRCNFEKSTGISITISKCIIRDSFFVRADYLYAKIEASCIHKSNFIDSKLDTPTIKNSVIFDTLFNGSTIKDGCIILNNFKYCLFSGTVFIRCDLGRSILRQCLFDYSSFPLWCGTLRANFDDKFIYQLAYHLVRAGISSTVTSKETKEELSKIIPLANKFHRVKECGYIELK